MILFSYQIIIIIIIFSLKNTIYNIRTRLLMFIKFNKNIYKHWDTAVIYNSGIIV